MTYSDRFIKLAREETQFHAYRNGNKAFFFKQQFGEGEYIYKISDWSNDPLFYFNPDLEPKLVCIKVKDSLYILDQYDCGLDYQAMLSEGVFDFNSVLTELNQKVNNEILPQYLASLDLSEQMENEMFINYSRRTAIQTLLSRDPTLKPLNVDSKFLNTCDAAKTLCGGVKLGDVALGKLRAKENEWTQKAAIHRMIQEFMEQDGIVSDTQRRIADALRPVNAKFVTVEFSFKGNIVTGKMDPSIIYSNLKEEDWFTDYNFATNIEGKRIFNALDAKGFGAKPENRLTWRNIVRIRYKGKILY